jgi:hypothetical protein
MPSLRHINIFFRMSKGKTTYKLFKKHQAVEVIQEWLEQADQYCSLLESLSINVDANGSYWDQVVFRCVRHQRDQTKKWKVQIWRLSYDTDLGPQTEWMVNTEGFESRHSHTRTGCFDVIA